MDKCTHQGLCDQRDPKCVSYHQRVDTIGEAYAILCAVTGQTARGALTHLSPEEVAAELHSLADAIDGTTDVAESMYAIPQIPRSKWESIGVDFSEVDLQSAYSQPTACPKWQAVGFSHEQVPYHDTHRRRQGVPP